MIDIFRECREQVSAQDAARYYGVEINRQGKACCPFHAERTPSMSFKNGRFKCFGCGASGDSITFTGRLLGLKPLAAVERLNTDFSLALPLNRKPTPAEAREARQRREVIETYQLFQRWRDDMIQQLNACFRLAHLTLKSIESPVDFNRLTAQEALAIQWFETLEYWSDCLMSDDMEKQMQIFRERREIGRLCEQILNHTLTKSGAA